jgi:hypothetical protein
MLEQVVATLAKFLFDILVSGGARWLARRMRITGAHDSILRSLEYKKFRPPTNALTTKEIKSQKIIRTVDTKIIRNKVKGRLEEGLGHWGLVRKQWDRDLSTPFTLDWKGFFVRLDPLFVEVILPILNEEYTDLNIACFVILPFPRNKKSRPTEAFEHSFEQCLGTRPICREFITSGILERKIKTAWLHRLSKGEKILVLQPVAMHDDYLKKTLQFIEKYSMGSVHQVVTMLDGSGRPEARRSRNPRERVLMEMVLSSPS